MDLVSVFHDYQSAPCPTALLESTAQEVLSREKVSRCVNIILCSDYKIKKLNTVYRQKPRPTDVLSFPFDDSDFLGEIYISLQRAAVQSRRFGHTYNEELKRLLVHGLLHLIGYSHDSEKSRTIMESIEKRYCQFGKAPRNT